MSNREIESFDHQADHRDGDLAASPNNNSNNSNKWSHSQQYVVKLRGLPWSATREEVLGFMSGCNVKNGIEGVHLVSRHGPIRGEAFVELDTEDDMELAMSKHREHMGTRYIEVFRSSNSEINSMMNPKASHNWRDPVVRLRGIPYYCTKDDIYDFFSGLQIAHNGVYMSIDDCGNASGLAFVAFTKMDIAQKALEKHRMMIGHRYVEVFQSSYAEARSKMIEEIEHNERMSYAHDRKGSIDSEYRRGGSSRSYYDRHSSRFHSPGPLRHRPSSMTGYGGSGGDMLYRSPPPLSVSMRSPASMGYDGVGHSSSSMLPCCVQMLGLPFSTSEQEIRQFFSPLRPVHIELHKDNRGRPAGTASVEFHSHEESLEAMKHDKQYIGSRYIDLTLSNSPIHVGGMSRSMNNPAMTRRYDEYIDEADYVSGMSPMHFGSQTGSRMKPEMF